MANERLVLTDFVSGTVENNPLTAAGTTLTSVGLATIPAIGATQYAELVLDPNGAGGPPEIVHVIQHVVGATPGVVAEIVRGREGTVARQHVQNIPWVMMPTAAMLGHDVDRAWEGNLVVAGGPYDYEFEREGSPTSLPTGWSWVNQGTATYTEEFGAGVVRMPSPSGAGDNVRMIVRPIPSLAAFDCYAKLTYQGMNGSTFGVGLVVRVSSSGKFVTFINHASTDNVHMEQFTNPTTWSAQYGQIGIRPLSPQYFRIRKNSATSWDFLISQDGVGWWWAMGSYDLTGFLTGTIDQIGFAVNAGQNKSGLYAACHWFRIR